HLSDRARGGGLAGPRQDYPARAQVACSTSLLLSQRRPYEALATCRPRHHLKRSPRCSCRTLPLLSTPPPPPPQQQQHLPSSLSHPPFLPPRPAPSTPSSSALALTRPPPLTATPLSPLPYYLVRPPPPPPPMTTQTTTPTLQHQH